MKPTTNDSTPTPAPASVPTAKQKIATIAGKLARNAPNPDLELFYSAVAEEFGRQVALDQARATVTIDNPSRASSGTTPPPAAK